MSWLFSAPNQEQNKTDYSCPVFSCPIKYVPSPVLTAFTGRGHRCLCYLGHAVTRGHMLS